MHRDPLFLKALQTFFGKRRLAIALSEMQNT